jgi:hypothetical protein
VASGGADRKDPARDPERALARAREVVRTEAEAVARLEDRIGEAFARSRRCSGAADASS